MTRSGEAGKAGSPPRPALAPPAGLGVDTFDEGGETFALLEWPVERPAAAPRRPTGSPVPPGAPAQREVLQLLLRGLSNAEIARLRRRSERTVAHQVDSIYRRLRVGSRAELIALATREGWARGTP
ncbi:MAG TPA: LuxR C-terminal-related transcriptional regulator [Anaeromyxobacteraceae bacterium]|nr:LuxR C-terminal-related transcriptional regulator [Anaeromyxobacteraceae bacterium]